MAVGSKTGIIYHCCLLDIGLLSLNTCYNMNKYSEEIKNSILL